MTQKGLSMRKVEEILRLKWEKGLSNRAIAKSCRISAGSVSNYIQRAKTAGLSWPLPEDLGADDLEALLFPHERLPVGRVIPSPDWRGSSQGTQAQRSDLESAVVRISCDLIRMATATVNIVIAIERGPSCSSP